MPWPHPPAFSIWPTFSSFSISKYWRILDGFVSWLQRHPLLLFLMFLPVSTPQQRLRRPLCWPPAKPLQTLVPWLTFSIPTLSFVPCLFLLRCWFLFDVALAMPWPHPPAFSIWPTFSSFSISKYWRILDGFVSWLQRHPLVLFSIALPTVCSFHWLDAVDWRVLFSSWSKKNCSFPLALGFFFVPLDWLGWSLHVVRRPFSTLLATHSTQFHWRRCPFRPPPNLPCVSFLCPPWFVDVWWWSCARVVRVPSVACQTWLCIPVLWCAMLVFLLWWHVLAPHCFVPILTPMLSWRQSPLWRPAILVCWANRSVGKLSILANVPRLNFPHWFRLVSVLVLHVSIGPRCRSVGPSLLAVDSCARFLCLSIPPRVFPGHRFFALLPLRRLPTRHLSRSHPTFESMLLLVLRVLPRPPSIPWLGLAMLRLTFGGLGLVQWSHRWLRQRRRRRRRQRRRMPSIEIASLQRLRWLWLAIYGAFDAQSTPLMLSFQPRIEE